MHNSGMILESAPLRRLSIARLRGFTLLELMVVVAIAAIMAALAAPSLRDFVVRNKMSSVGNEFTGSLLRARNEAVSRNTCVTMCMSTTVEATGTGTQGPVCATTGDDWQVGWIVFLDTTCANTAGPNTPEDLIFVRQGAVSDYHLSLPTDGNLRAIEFGARGLNGLANAGRFDLNYKDNNSKETQKFGYTICLSALGRSRNITPAGTACS